MNFSRVGILLSILVLIEIVFLSVDLQMVLELTSLLLDVLGNEIVNIIE